QAFYMSDNNNSELQSDELTALASIYEDEITEFNAKSGSFAITIRGSSSDCDGKASPTVTLSVTFPPSYPTECPPVFELSAPWLRGESRRLLENRLVAVCQDFAGCPVVYAWAEAVRQFIDEHASAQCDSAAADDQDSHSSASSQPTAAVPAALSPESAAAAETAEFVHGEPIEDRRSVFQAHLLAPVHSVQLASNALAQLLSSEKKIASATHNIWAYRIVRQSQTGQQQGVSFYTDCDDDGEQQAGGRLLRLLELSDTRNALVVVSRWFGGTLLGPDRFKHINNAARNLLEQRGVIETRGAKRNKN
ncbi:hypothetical protein BOX15_Mlig032342g4, partial [Macrostomum lignano]